MQVNNTSNVRLSFWERRLESYSQVAKLKGKMAANQPAFFSRVACLARRVAHMHLSPESLARFFGALVQAGFNEFSCVAAWGSLLLKPFEESIKARDEASVRLLILHMPSWIYPQHLQLAMDANAPGIIKLLLDSRFGWLHPLLIKKVFGWALNNGHHDLALKLLSTGVSHDPIPDYSHLQIASERGYEMIVAALLTLYGELIDMGPPLFAACRAGHEETAFKFLEGQRRYSFLFSGGSNLLHAAAQGGCTKVLQMLLRTYGNFINQPNSHQETPLHIACQNGHPECALTLIYAGADVTVQNSAGATALSYAAEKGWTDVVEKILERVPPARLKAYLCEGYPLAHAFEKHHRGVAEILLDKGAPLLKSFLYSAVKNSWWALIPRLLYKVPADKRVKYVNKQFGDKTSLTITLKRGNQEIAQALVKAGVCFIVRDLSSLISKNLNEEEVRYWFKLISSQLSLEDLSYGYVFYCSSPNSTASRSHLLFRLFLEAGVNPLHHHENGTNFLHQIATTGQMGLLERLWPSGEIKPLLDSVDTNNNTPLTLAFQNEHFEMAAALLELGANPFINETAFYELITVLYQLLEKKEIITERDRRVFAPFVNEAEKRGLKLTPEYAMKYAKLCAFLGLRLPEDITLDLRPFFNLPPFSDQCYTVHGQQIRVKGAILKNRADLFETEFNGSQDLSTIIKEEDIPHFISLLKFLYSGSLKAVAIDPDNFKGLARVADACGCQTLTACLKEWVQTHPECAHWMALIGNSGKGTKRKAEEISESIL